MPAAWHYQDEATLIRKIEVGTLGNNMYVVACAATGAAIIVDAAADPTRIIAETRDVSPIAIVTTHGHHDHVGAVDPVRQALGIPMYLNAADAEICPVSADRKLLAGTFPVGEMDVDVIFTPGHTPGSSSLGVGGALLTGDTLFPGGPGATRFPYSDFELIMTSIETKLMKWPDETIVMPGHGVDTTIGTERPRLAEWRSRGW